MKIKYKNNAAYFPKKDICVVSDLHIGLEDKLIKQGISFPFNEMDLLKNKLEEIIETFNPSKIVYNGDILHEFGGIPPSVPKKLDQILEIKTNHAFVQGSHDTMLKTLLKKRGYTVRNYYELENLALTHGDKKINELEDIECELLVLGHEHPSIEIYGEKKDCFLLQKECYPSKDILVLPAFSELSEGVKVNELSSKDFMSPYLKKCKIDDFEVVLETEEDILSFPKMGKFRKKL